MSSVYYFKRVYLLAESHLCLRWSGWTLLVQAACSGSLEMVRWLVEEVGVDRFSSGGKTAKQLADEKGHADVSRYLGDAVPDRLSAVRSDSILVISCLNVT